MNGKVVFEKPILHWCHKMLGIFILLFSSLYFLFPMFFYQTLFRDEVQNLAWGHIIRWSYDIHPPLGAWFITFLNFLFSDMRVASYSAAVLCVMVSLYFVYRLSSFYLNAWQTLVACLLSTLTIFYLNNFVLEFNQNTIMLPFWAMVCYFTDQSLRDNRWRDWFLLGVVTAFAILSKYESLMIIGLMFLWLIFHFRARYFIKLLVAFGLTCILCLPHIMSVAKDGFLPILFIQSRVDVSFQHGFLYRHLYYPVETILSQIIHISISLLALTLLIKTKIIKKIPSSNLNTDRNFLLYLGIAPFCLLIIISCIWGIHIMPEWGFPLYIFTIPALMSYFEVSSHKGAIKKILILVLCAHVFALVSYKMFHYYSSKRHSTNYPGYSLAEKAAEYWRQYNEGSINFVGGDRPLNYFLAVYLKNKPYILENFSFVESPWIDPKLAKKQGILIAQLDCRQSDLNKIQKQFFIPHYQCFDIAMSNKHDLKTMPIALMIAYPK